ncbi:MAG: hypothetical protein JOY54_17450 [Acidobacteriaceae bacterium]|nr:hypothetical protein [Acidobacteriaceae bacterium]
MKSHVPETKANELVHPHGPSQAIHGHEHTSFEDVDARAGLVIWSLAIIGGTLVVVFALTIGIQKILTAEHPPGQLPSPLAPERVLAPAPQLQVHPWEELPEMRAHEDQMLNSYGKYQDGRFHVPINVAMEAVLPRLKIAPDAPKGITTPGGGGRDFSGSIHEMPAPYQRPQIQGEIQKNAQ